jgi:hypothetical protein
MTARRGLKWIARPACMREMKPLLRCVALSIVGIALLVNLPAA